MSVAYNTSIVFDSTLALCLDAANSKSYDSRENLLLFSEQANDANWGKGDITVSADVVASPLGTGTADKLVESTTAGAYHYRNQGVTKPAAATTYTYSLYVKNAGRGAVGLRIDSSGNGAAVTYNLTTGAQILVPGTYGTFTNASSTITNVGDGWWRISLTVTSDTATSISVQEYLYSLVAGSTVYTGDGTSGVYVWGGQFERGSSATAYAITTATNITRSTSWTDMIGGGSSVATNGPQFSSNNGGYFNMAAASSQYFQHPVYSALNITNNLTLEAWVYPTTWNNVGGILTYGTDAAEQYALWTSNSSQFVFSSNWPGTWYQLYNGSTLSAGNWYHVAVTFASGTAIMYINGVLVNSTAAFGITTLPAVASAYLTIGNNHPGGDEMLDGRVGLARVYSRVLTPAEIKQNFNAYRGRYGV